MKAHITSDAEIRNSISNAIKSNDGYCPSVVDSKGKAEYQCMCRDFIENTPAGASCHCGLYIKDEQ